MSFIRCDTNLILWATDVLLQYKERMSPIELYVDDPPWATSFILWAIYGTSSSELQPLLPESQTSLFKLQTSEKLTVKGINFRKH